MYIDLHRMSKIHSTHYQSLPGNVYYHLSHSCSVFTKIKMATLCSCAETHNTALISFMLLKKFRKIRQKLEVSANGTSILVIVSVDPNFRSCCPILIFVDCLKDVNESTKTHTQRCHCIIVSSFNNHNHDRNRKNV